MQAGHTTNYLTKKKREKKRQQQKKTARHAELLYMCVYSDSKHDAFIKKSLQREIICYANKVN